MNTTWLKNLETLGEWMAYGYYEAEDKPWPISYGRAYRRLYENMQINIFPDRLMAPCEPLPNAMTRESDNIWFATSLICDFNHHCGIRTNKNIAEIRKTEHPKLTNFIDEFYADMQSRCKHYGGYTHNNPDIRRVVSEGFLVMEKELDDELSAVKNAGKNTDADELNFLLALKEYTTGIKAFHSRVLAALQDAADQAEESVKTKRKRIAAAFANSFLRPAEDFLEGLLAVHFTWMLDNCDSIGRFDQALGGLYEQDLNSGKLDLPFIRELLDELWHNFERFNGWNLQIGGRRPDGSDGSNLLTEECILACERNRFRRPNVAFRITDDTPDKLIGSVLKSLANGSGRPALYNDDLYIRTLHDMDLGLNEEDAREIGFGGCTETMIAGMSNVGSLEGTINLAKAIELTINDGFDPVTAEQAGPHTGSFSVFKSFDDFFAACKRQIQYMTDTFVEKSNEELKKRFKSGDPKLYRSFFTRDCVKNHKSFESGGARYNWSVVTYQGIANAIDSLAAVKKLVFDDKTLSVMELAEALENDFKGNESLRQKLLLSPKFGNDDIFVDSIGAELLDFAWRELYSHSPPRGGRYLASCILFVTYLDAGRRVGATPDGRHAHTALNDSVGAVAGRDRHGPTAHINSVCSLPMYLAVGTPVFNLRMRKDMLQNDREAAKVIRLIRTYFQKGGMQMQISVIDSKAMREAQVEPEKHSDLIVRIGGYSEYFTRLEKELQDTVIARSEITL